MLGSVSCSVWQMACRRVIKVGERVVKEFMSESASVISHVLSLTVLLSRFLGSRASHQRQNFTQWFKVPRLIGGRIYHFPRFYASVAGHMECYCVVVCLLYVAPGVYEVTHSFTAAYVLLSGRQTRCSAIIDLCSLIELHTAACFQGPRRHISAFRI